MTARPCRICALSKDDIGSSTPRKHFREYPKARLRAGRYRFADFFPNRLRSSHDLRDLALLLASLDRGRLDRTAFSLQVLRILLDPSLARERDVSSLGDARCSRSVYCRWISVPFQQCPVFHRLHLHVSARSSHLSQSHLPDLSFQFLVDLCSRQSGTVD